MLTNFAGGDWNVFKLLFVNRWLIVIRRLFFGDGTSLNLIGNNIKKLKLLLTEVIQDFRTRGDSIIYGLLQ